MFRSARDIARAKKFYDAALKPLGFSLLSDGESSLGYGEKAVRSGSAPQEAGEGRDGLRAALLLPRQGPRRRRCLSCRRAGGGTDQRQARRARRLLSRNITPRLPSTPTAIGKRLLRKVALRPASLHPIWSDDDARCSSGDGGREGCRLRHPDPGVQRHPATRWTWPEPKAYIEAFPHLPAFGGVAFEKAARCASARPVPRLAAAERIPTRQRSTT